MSQITQKKKEEKTNEIWCCGGLLKIGKIVLLGASRTKFFTFGCVIANHHTFGLVSEIHRTFCRLIENHSAFGLITKKVSCFLVKVLWGGSSFFWVFGWYFITSGLFFSLKDLSKICWPKRRIIRTQHCCGKYTSKEGWCIQAVGNTRCLYMPISSYRKVRRESLKMSLPSYLSVPKYENVSFCLIITINRLLEKNEPTA